ncbi:MAG: glutaredoxin [SAR202 cluster bacterium]|nr:glutaredoxin [SAR202 cluster bacterium]
MTMLQASDRQQITRRFEEGLDGDVTVRLFTQGLGGLFVPGRECQTCEPTRKLLQEVCDLSPRLHLEVIDFYKDRQAAEAAGVDRIPTIVIEGGGATGGRLRYYGMPSGIEFSVLLQAILNASKRDSGLKPETREELASLTENVHIQVFVTPTCPYCPGVAGAAHAMALESPRVRADVVEVQEFPQFARAYNVRSVPMTVINDKTVFTGAVNETGLLERILETVGMTARGEDAAPSPEDAHASPGRATSL